jgi:hypothetical protein
MILRRTDEGAEKCALRDLRLEEETSVQQIISIRRAHHSKVIQSSQIPSSPHLPKFRQLFGCDEDDPVAA